MKIPALHPSQKVGPPSGTEGWYGVMFLYTQDGVHRLTVSVPMATATTRVCIPNGGPEDEDGLPSMDIWVLIGEPIREEDHWCAIYVLDLDD